MKSIAKEYMNYGLSCLPVKLDKSPNVNSWKDGVKDLSLFENCEGIGIICGELSGGLECLDFDNHFGDAKTTLSKFISLLNGLYEKYKFPIQETQNGGFHLLYRCKKNEGNKKLASKPKYDEKRKRFIPDAIIETRGEGGYFVAAPTKGYKVVRNNILDIKEITEQERKFIIEVARSYNEWSEPKITEYENKEKPGDIYNKKLESISEAKECLKRNGWTELKKGIWQRPDKKKGISATFGQVAPNLFYNFSSNAYPFEPEQGYFPFQIIALLDYKGDFKEFASILAKRYDLNKKTDFTKLPEKEKPKKDYEFLMNKCYIDLEIKPPKPPIILRISDQSGTSTIHRRLLTLGNFSVIKGKSKAKKTFATAMPMAALIRKSHIAEKFYADLPNNKGQVIRFDTEQGAYDAFVAGKRVEILVGYQADHYGVFGLRELNEIERCEIIEYIIDKYKDNLGFVLIDGVADLAKGNNEESEGIRITNLLMRLTSKYNLHICVIIHENKNDSFATGHVGSYLMKKAEVIISVEKTKDKRVSIVKCDMIRGVEDFDDFAFRINNEGLPELTEIEDQDEIEF